MGTWSCFLFLLLFLKQPCLIFHGKSNCSLEATCPGRAFPSIFIELIRNTFTVALRNWGEGNLVQRRKQETAFSCFLFSRRVFLGFLHTFLSHGYSWIYGGGLERKGIWVQPQVWVRDRCTADACYAFLLFNSTPTICNHSPPSLKYLLMRANNRGHTNPSPIA